MSNEALMLFFIVTCHGGQHPSALNPHFKPLCMSGGSQSLGRGSLDTEWRPELSCILAGPHVLFVHITPNQEPRHWKAAGGASVSSNAGLTHAALRRPNTERVYGQIRIQQMCCDFTPLRFSWSQIISSGTDTTSEGVQGQG